MTPQQVEEAARRRYNAENDTFYSQDELFKIITEGELELCTFGLVIEGKDTSISTVVGQRVYDFPTNFISIKRVEYLGVKLEPVDFRDDDRLSVSNSATTSTGSPQYYQIWGKQIYLRPLPDAVNTLTIYGYKEPALLTTASTTLSVPSEFHFDLVDYVAMQLCAKDKDYSGVKLYESRWMDAKNRARQWMKRRKRGDAFAWVRDEANDSTTIIGTL